MRIPEEILSQWDITDADKAALVDLPDAVEPFFHADPQWSRQRDEVDMTRLGIQFHATHRELADFAEHAGANPT